MGLRKGGTASEETGATPIVVLKTSSGGTDINTSTMFPWDSTSIIDEPFSYTAGNDYVTVNKPGTYTVAINIGMSTGGSERDNPNARLFKNRTSSGTGGTQLSASGKTGYTRESSGHNQSSLHLTWTGNLVSGDLLSIQMSEEASYGTRTPVINECNMTVKKEFR